MCEVFCEQLCTISPCYDHEKGALWTVSRVLGLVQSLSQGGSSFPNPCGPVVGETTLQTFSRFRAPFTPFPAEVGLPCRMSGARADKSRLGIFTAGWPKKKKSFCLCLNSPFSKKIGVSATERGWLCVLRRFPDHEQQQDAGCCCR